MIRGTTNIISLIGWPVEHSISPQIHNAAYEALNLDFCYVPFAVRPGKLKEAVIGLRFLNLKGANITIPFKEEIIKYLDETDNDAAIIGAVNTVKNKNRKLIGYNTDILGFIQSLKEDLKFHAAGKNVFVLGAGGGSSAVCFGLIKEKINSLTIFDLDKKKENALVKRIKKHSSIKIEYGLLNNEEIFSAVNNAQLIVNATPAGMFPNTNISPLPEGYVTAKHSVYDLVYNPPETKLLKISKASGTKTQNGLGMLIRQAAASFEIICGRKAPIKIMKEAAQKAIYG
jgi:shikimate dehydrogenase